MAPPARLIIAFDELDRTDLQGGGNCAAGLTSASISNRINRGL